MNPKNQNPTKEYNKRQTNEKKKKIAQESIFKALSDGQWHQNVELLSTTKLSSPTLHKHLKTMTKNQLIEKKTDIINGKHAVLFKAETYLLSYIEGKKAREYFSDNVDAILEETKNNPLIILDMIHNISQLAFISILEQIQKNKIPRRWENVDYLEEVYLWTNYQYLTNELMKATCKIIDKIDIKQLLISEPKRQKEIWEKVMKHYEELGITKK